MSRRGVQFVLLCEDQQQDVFMRRFLKRHGYEPYRMRSMFSPKGKQSGEHYVRAKYPVELEAYRAKCGHLAIALSVMIDADTLTVEERVQQLDMACDARTIPRRKTEEKVGIFAPKRNIETWVHYLNGVKTDEVSVYPKLKYPSDCEQAVRRLSELCKRNEPGDGLPNSLQKACREFERFR